MKILYYEAYNGIKELSAEWFNGFNWQNFEYGEIVWLEDNDETNRPAARFLRIEDDAVKLMGVSYEVAYREHKVR